MVSLRARFPKDDGFHAALKRGAAAYFAAVSRPRWGGRAMYVKTALILGWFVGSYALLLALGGTSAWLAVALTLSTSLAIGGIGFSVMHDANHGAYARSPLANRALGFTVDVVGASSYVWRFKHNVQHHTFANVDGLDADIDAAPFLRLAPSQPVRALHRWQHLYAWPLYGVLAVKWWFVDDAMDLIRGRIGDVRFPRPGGGELAGVIAGKAIFVAWSLVLPLLLFRTAWVVALFLLGSFTLGVIMAVVFQLAHAVEDATFLAAGPGREGRLPAAWAEHQVRATVDFAPANRLLGWYVGGLNFQVVHHLFPQVCHVHYPALAAMVADTCAAHGVPYRSQPTLRAAVAAHYRYLRKLGAPGGASPAVAASA
jgi:linoleoyl-CoA desaturase